MSRTLALVLAILALPLGASAAPRSRVVEHLLTPPGAAAVTLRGMAPSWETVVPVDALGDRASAPTLALSLEASELLDMRRSTITVEVDGEPRRSVPLARARGVLRLALGDLEGGFHRIGLRARLVVPDDPCLERHDRDAWVRVEGGIAWRRQAGRTGAEEATLGEVFARLGGGSFRIERANGTGAPATAAFLEAVALLTHMGAVAFDAEDADPGDEDDEPVTLRLGLAPVGEAVGRVAVSADALEVQARDWTLVAATLETLRAETLRSRCAERSSCLVGTTPAPEASEGEEASEGNEVSEGEETARSAEVALPPELAKLGWTARGEGRHTLRFTWERPAGWELEAHPELTLEARFPHALGATSRVAVRLVEADREVPLGAFPIDEPRPDGAREGALRGALERRIVVRIPEPRWSDPVWTFEIEATLRSEEGEACDAVGDALWLHLDPRTRLTLPRREAAPEGLAGWAAGLTARPTLVLPPKLGEAARLQLGLLVAELAELPGPFPIAAPGDATEGPRVRLLADDAEDEAGQLRREHADGELVYRDAGGTWAMPLLPVDECIVLERPDNAGHAVNVALVRNVEGARAPLAWAGLRTAAALHHDGSWALLGEPVSSLAEPVEVRATEGDEALRVASVAESRTRLIDIATGGLALIVLGMGFGVLRRRQRTA